MIQPTGEPVTASLTLRARIENDSRIPAAAEGGAPPHMRVIAAGLTDVGLQREHNEDSFCLLGEYSLFLVADGMGGHRAGDVASRMATSAIASFFRSSAGEDATWPFHF